MSEDKSEHIMPVIGYVGIWLCLIFLTGVTVAVSFVDMQNLTLFTALFVATIKSTLVLLYFMHLRHDQPIIFYMILACLGSYAVFVILTYSDYLYR
ncbi:MAG: cytochrome C oxidase subunit IV family protein [Planctomycetes bacterium]|nr:cytochrome C oxidase subunit IV family protein [Planctomycetota bacterium]